MVRFANQRSNDASSSLIFRFRFWREERRVRRKGEGRRGIEGGREREIKRAERQIDREKERQGERETGRKRDRDKESRRVRQKEREDRDFCYLYLTRNSYGNKVWF